MLPPPQQSDSTIKRWIFLSGGFLFFALGIVGAFIPVLPTVPFLIVAVYCFSKSSKRFHDWLMYHPKFGPPLQDWFARGVIRVRAKVLSIVLLTAGMVWPVFIIQLPDFLRWACGIVWLGVCFFLLSRPSK